jgi:hypothetical protein
MANCKINTLLLTIAASCWAILAVLGTQETPAIPIVGLNLRWFIK